MASVSSIVSRPAPRRHAAPIASVLLAALIGCGGGSSPAAATSTADQRSAAAPAVDALRAGRFADARTQADRVLAADGRSSVAAAVRALGRYEAAVDRLLVAFEGIERELGGPAFDDSRLRASFREAEQALAVVDRDLAVAAADPDFSLELCPACWERDWNRSGEIDDRDRRLFQVERSADGSDMPPDDPRRTPTFRLDVGDVHWARAMVSYQRAGLDLLAAYRWNDVARMAPMIFGQPGVVRFPLVDRARVGQARERILEGIDHAERARVAYLDERDDDREWVPSPRQSSHGLPLPVDAALYDTWAGVNADLRRLVRGEEGLDLGEVVRALEPRWQTFRAGYLDVGRMFAEPRDIVIDLPALQELGEGPAALEASFRVFFGVYYATAMKPSPLVARLARMRAEIDRGDETLERKLRYLLWLN
jgi:hypothetical protein